MTASTQTAPRQLSFGRFPMAIAALAMVAILALVIALVALNATKAAAPATGAKAAPPPAVIDHGWSNGETDRVLAARRIQIQSFGGFGGPRLVAPNIHGRGWTGPALRPQ